MQDDVERTPRRQVEEPHGIALERADAGLRHEEQRENHRKHRKEDDGQHDVQDRHPGHRLLRDRVVGVARLNVGPRLRKGVDCRGASAAGHAVARLHECVDGRVLAHRLGEIAPRSGKGGVRDRHVVLELVGSQGVAQLGVDLLAPQRSVGLDHRRPLGVKCLIGLPTGDDEVLDGAVALSLQPFLRARLRSRPDRRP